MDLKRCGLVTPSFKSMYLNLLLQLMSPSNVSAAQKPRARREKHSRLVQIIDVYSDAACKQNMLLERSTINYLILKYSQYQAKNKKTWGLKGKSPKDQIYMYIWYITQQITFQQLGKRFGVTTACSKQSVTAVCLWLNSISHNFVRWPKEFRIAEACQRFEDKMKIPGVSGVVDCTHIKFNMSKISDKSYLDKQHNKSIILQVVVDADSNFTSVYCGEPGSTKYSRVLQKSQIYAKMKTSTEFLLGGLAYTPTNRLVTPFIDNGDLSHVQIHFNYLHSAACDHAKQALTSLKERFKRLCGFSEQNKIEDVTNIVLSACTLYNICNMRNDLYVNNNEQEPEFVLNNSAAEVQRGVDRRQMVFENLVEQNFI